MVFDKIFAKHINTARTTALVCVVGLSMALSPYAFAEPRAGGEITYLSSNVPSLNPLNAQFDVGLVTSQIFASLLRLDENNQPAPYLATDWKISEDGLTYTFSLHEDAVFHDGTPVTSGDVKFSVAKIMEHHRFANQMFGPIDIIKTPDDKTVVLHSQNPTVRF